MQVQTTPLYAAYNLLQDEVARLQDMGCYRGLYGGNLDNEARAMSLLTCEVEGATKIADVPADAPMCVLELKSGMGVQDIKAEIIRSADTEVLFVGDNEDEVVVVSVSGTGDYPSACVRETFGEAVDNTRFVPTQPFVAEHAENLPARIQQLRSGARLQPLRSIEDAVASFSQANLERTIEEFATGNTGSNLDVSRNSYAIRVGAGGCETGFFCANDATDEAERRLNDIMSGYVGEYEIKQETFRADMCNNVVLTIPGRVDPDTIIVSGSHLDSRNTNAGSSARGESPGADDNGTGSSVQLEIARVIVEQQLTFGNTLRLVLFCGEEQGLFGSAYDATQSQQRGDNIIAMFNADMIGYTVNNQRQKTITFSRGTVSEALTSDAIAFSQMYVPEVRTDRSSACCSDQQSYQVRGFPAISLFETPTNSVVYPQYHRTGDTFDNGLIDYEQVVAQGRAIFASTLEYLNIQ